MGFPVSRALSLSSWPVLVARDLFRWREVQVRAGDSPGGQSLRQAKTKTVVKTLPAVISGVDHPRLSGHNEGPAGEAGAE